MEDRESGSLSRKPALELLVELHRGLVTGSLKLERAPLQKAVYFRDGQILFAASNDPKDQLASILVEEGKLGPDQMQVAQARVSPGNPLAKVLTELGYISQRELADAARVKVEKILTDLYTWKEGTYQFATKSLPKGAIDLELSTSRLLFASIRRLQDREWVLRQLGSLDTVLTPTPSLTEFIADSQPEPLAADVLRSADGTKSVKQIGAISSLGEFEVCKVLAAALVVGAMTKEGAPSIAAPTANSDAFSFPSAPESFSFPSSPEPSFGSETMVVPPPGPEEPMSYDTIFQAAVVKPSKPPVPPADEVEKTVFEPAPVRRPPPPITRPVPRIPEPDPPKASAASELLIDEPEPASDALHSRVAPRPRRKSGGGTVSRGAGGLLKWVGVTVVAAAAGVSVYYFVWPLIGGGGGSSTPSSTVASSSGSSGSPSQTTSSIPPRPVPPAGATAAPTTDPGAGTTDPRAGTATSSTPPSGAPIPPPRVTTTSPPATSSIPNTASGAPKPPIPAPKPPEPRVTDPPSGAPRPPPGSNAGANAGRDGRALLEAGNLVAAARAFQQEISSTGPDKFTVALGLYCNQENVGRLVAGAGDSSQVYVLPTSVDGRTCYRVIWGLFDSRDAAENSIDSLPGGLRAGDAAPVAVSRFLR